MSTHPSHLDLGRFTFESGESIETLTVAYETYGEYDGDNAVLVCHALTGSAHVARGAAERSAEAENGDSAEDDAPETAGQASAWWDDVVGPGKAIDTTEQFVVCANVPGSCYGTTGPASLAPDGEPYGTDFPPVTVADWTRAQRRLVDELGVDSLSAVVGGSVGGMNVLEWAKRYPGFVDRVVPVATAARLDPQCLALDAVARRAITTDPNWNGGEYYGASASDTSGVLANEESENSSERSSDGGSSDVSDGGDHPDRGLALARQIGHVMYLSKDSMERKFGRNAAGREAIQSALRPNDPAGEFFPYRDVESYLDHQADSFVDRFDANSYLALTRAMDNYDLATGAESDADALSGFDGEALVLSFTGDWHFTVEQGEHLAAAFREAGASTAHHVVESDHGHDAFLVEPDAVGPPLADFLADGVNGDAVTDTESITRSNARIRTHTGRSHN